ncbi:Asp-tRNA(Asn)/Glu-tRNA(Gln) amidotransferase subunit GatC [Roseisolibacter agri]|uniref:Glutamyl-tRNA(Gln) amidotransferase subunit C n=1 Tax=Roseisolibacter agri TaxID=2014610 RepID=A0AA37V1P6_9BACT|nr:Asp-tRNA(Asn)/Glu-tRNA(Gln) amidotransferase subunit GatC [Roseisolibacter agri]GLC26590.1 hypothetical protein rosag_31030 [Roseisolibacter agri]
MSVSEHDVRHIAALARLGLEPERVPALVAELNGILAHMDVLSKVNTSVVQAVEGVGAGGMPLRADGGAPDALARPREAFAPETRDGFFLVPRLATHVASPDAMLDATAGDEGDA